MYLDNFQNVFRATISYREQSQSAVALSLLIAPKDYIAAMAQLLPELFQCGWPHNTSNKLI